MSSLLDHYRVLGVSVGAGMTDVTSSYKRLCRLYHPDVSSDPKSEEQMKRINIAYTVLREKLRREALFRDRQAFSRSNRRYGNADARSSASEARSYGQEARTYASEARVTGEEAEREAFSILQGYFKAIGAFDYSGAYNYLSTYDKKLISRESFTEWRKSVARVYPMREFTISGGLSVATVTFKDGKSLYARRFRVAVTEEDFARGAMHSGDVEKLVIFENGLWKVFLGYNSVGDLTREFDERFEIKLKRDVAKHWEEYYAGMHHEYNMLSLTGMRGAVSREIYRQQRFGGTLTFAVISIQTGGARGGGHEQLLRSAAKTIAGSLRETDIPAYAGDGLFAVLLVELRKKNADDIVNRLIEKIRRNAGPQLGARAEIEYTYGSWSGSGSMDMEAINKILRKFRKKM